LPLFGKRMTTTVHLPGRTAFRLVPTKAQYLLPFVMLIRIVPTDRFGMAIDTEAASFAALTVDPRRITIGRISNTTFGAALTSANETGASVVLVVVDEIETEVAVVVKVDVTVVGGTVVGATVVGGTVVGATVVGGTVVGATVVGATVVGATVVGATVVGATVVGATVVGATVVGATVVGATVVGATVVGATVVGATVVVGTTLRVEIAVAVETFDCEPIPS
jgi:hypothetical protein